MIRHLKKTCRKKHDLWIYQVVKQPNGRASYLKETQAGTWQKK